MTRLLEYVLYVAAFVDNVSITRLMASIQNEDHISKHSDVSETYQT